MRVPLFVMLVIFTLAGCSSVGLNSEVQGNYGRLDVNLSHHPDFRSHRVEYSKSYVISIAILDRDSIDGLLEQPFAFPTPLQGAGDSTLYCLVKIDMNAMKSMEHLPHSTVIKVRDKDLVYSGLQEIRFSFHTPKEAFYQIFRLTAPGETRTQLLEKQTVDLFVDSIFFG